jgi:formylmethanofuran dehydrogenase subunit E-like metal-binding protein
MRINLINSIKTIRAILCVSLMLTIFSGCSGPAGPQKENKSANLNKWELIGKMAGEKAVALIQKSSITLKNDNLIVLANAGYSEINGHSTQAALDGITGISGVSRGKNTLVEIHSAPWAPLWFAVFDRASGYCAYLEVRDSENIIPDRPGEGIFDISSVERIDPDYLYSNASEYKDKFDNKIFGGNEFRILTIANAIAKGAPAYVVRTLEFHDHYCPGVNSGIIMANYIKKYFPCDDTGYFIQSVTPWCKEDAFQVMLNVTAGKRSYSIYHPSDSDLEARRPDLKDINTIVYRHEKNSDHWQGIALAFVWADTNTPSTGNGLIDKMHDALWYLDHLDTPENFVKVIKSFDLPKDTRPEEWARPGVDPLDKIFNL